MSNESRDAHKRLAKFIDGCRKRKVEIEPEAMKRAIAEKLATDPVDAQRFIVELYDVGELVDPAKPTVRKYGKLQGIGIEAYHFKFNGQKSYLAFQQFPKTGKWIVKSLHIDNDEMPLSGSMSEHDPDGKLMEFAKTLAEGKKSDDQTH